jgi:hypothetical protein
MGLILSDAEREAELYHLDRVGRPGERRNFHISDAKMKLPVPNRSGWYDGIPASE